MPRPTRCRRCGAPITQPATGRPRVFCGTACRRSWHEIMAPLRSAQPPLSEPSPFHSPDADRRLRALHAEMRSLSRRCLDFATEMEVAGDPLELVRLAAAGTAIECVLAEHFGDLEEKP